MKNEAIQELQERAIDWLNRVASIFDLSEDTYFFTLLCIRIFFSTANQTSYITDLSNETPLIFRCCRSCHRSVPAILNFTPDSMINTDGLKKNTTSDVLFNFRSVMHLHVESLSELPMFACMLLANCEEIIHIWFSSIEYWSCDILKIYS